MICVASVGTPLAPRTRWRGLGGAALTNGGMRRHVRAVPPWTTSECGQGHSVLSLVRQCAGQPPVRHERRRYVWNAAWSVTFPSLPPETAFPDAVYRRLALETGVDAAGTEWNASL